MSEDPMALPIIMHTCARQRGIELPDDWRDHLGQLPKAGKALFDHLEAYFDALDPSPSSVA